MPERIQKTPAVRLCLLSMLVVAFLAGQVGAAQAKTIIGWAEDAYIYPEAFVVKAKIDTGAAHSSLNAPTIRFYEHQGARWLSFSLANRYGETILIQRPLARTARVKRHHGQVQERPVITLELCVSGTRRAVDVNVVDRTGFDYQLLIGRSFLQNDFLVDPAATGRSNANCKIR